MASPLSSRERAEALAELEGVLDRDHEVINTIVRADLAGTVDKIDDYLVRTISAAIAEMPRRMRENAAERIVELILSILLVKRWKKVR